MLADRLYDAMTATFDLLAVHVGEQLGWYAALAESPRTPAELAAATHTDERYAREWLERYTAPLARFATSIPLSEVIEAYRACHERLRQPGARVAELACGGGWASIAIARAYPQAEVHGFDIDQASIELARANAHGVPVTFDVRDITEVRRMAASASTSRARSWIASNTHTWLGGTAIVMDEKTGDPEHDRCSTASASSAACRPAGRRRRRRRRARSCGRRRCAATPARRASTTPSCSTSSTRPSASTG